MTLEEIVSQLKSCGFTCEAGKLENNVAFMELEKMSENENTKIQLTECSKTTLLTS